MPQIFSSLINKLTLNQALDNFYSTTVQNTQSYDTKDFDALSKSFYLILDKI